MMYTEKEIEELANKYLENLKSRKYKRLRLPNDDTPYYPYRELRDYNAIKDMDITAPLYADNPEGTGDDK